MAALLWRAGLAAAQVALAVAGPPTPGGAPAAAAGGEHHWPQQKGDVNRTGSSPHPVASDLSREPTWVWQDPFLDVIRSTPLIDGELNIYLGTQEGRVWSFSPDGIVRWAYTSHRGPMPAVPSIMGGSLFGNTAIGTVFALDLRTGHEQWAAQVSPAGVSGDTACLFALNGTVISAARRDQSTNRNNMVVALSAGDGGRLWSFNHTWGSFNFQASSPGDGTIVFQDHFGGVYRIQLADGRLMWESGRRDRQPDWFTTGATVVGPNGLVYSVSNYYNKMGIIHAYRLDDGAFVWQVEVGTEANQAVAVGHVAGHRQLALVAGVGENPGYPVMGSLLPWLPMLVKQGIHALSVWSAGKPTWLWRTKVLKAQVIAIDAATGARLWEYTPPPFTRPSCEGDEAMLGPRFDAKKLDLICLPDNFAQAVIGGDGTAYLGHQDGRLYAIRDADGSGQIEGGEVSSYYFGAAFQASQAIAPGMLAVAPCGGGLYVWKTPQ